MGAIRAAIWAQAERMCCSGAATPLWLAMHGPEATRGSRAAARRWVAKGCPPNAVPAALLPFWR